MALLENEAPWSRLSMSANSANVMSFCVSTADRITSRNASIRCERTSPPMGRALGRPSSRQARTQRMAVAIPTRNRSAAPARQATIHRGEHTRA